MKTAKKEAFDLIKILPDDVPMETLVEELLFKASVVRGQEQPDCGELLSREDVRQHLDKVASKTTRLSAAA